MEQIWRGTTPTLTFEYTDESGEQTIDLSTWTVYLSLTDGFLIHTFNNNRITFNSDHTFSITLTEAETLALHSNKITVQLRAKKDGVLIASDDPEISLEGIIYDSAISSNGGNE